MSERETRPDGMLEAMLTALPVDELNMIVGDDGDLLREYATIGRTITSLQRIAGWPANHSADVRSGYEHLNDIYDRAYEAYERLRNANRLSQPRVVRVVRTKEEYEAAVHDQTLSLLPQLGAREIASPRAAATDSPPSSGPAAPSDSQTDCAKGPAAWWPDKMREGRSSITACNALTVTNAHSSLFRAASAAEDEELRTSVLNLGVQRELFIAGQNCASPPGTVLAGTRRLKVAQELGLAEVATRTFDNLSEEEERRVMISDNLTTGVGRKLTLQQREALEHALRETWAPTRSRGRPRKGSGVEANTISPPAPQTALPRPLKARERVARATGESTNAVATRQKIVRSAVTSPEFIAAVDEGRISPSRAATILRDVERAHRLNDPGEEGAPEVLHSARQEALRRLGDDGGKRSARTSKSYVGSHGDQEFRLTLGENRLVLERRQLSSRARPARPVGENDAPLLAEARNLLKVAADGVSWWRR